MSEQSVANQGGPMTFGLAISRGFRQYLSGSGRVTRAEFWWLYLFAVLVTTPANI